MIIDGIKLDDFFLLIGSVALLSGAIIGIYLILNRIMKTPYIIKLILHVIFFSVGITLVAIGKSYGDVYRIIGHGLIQVCIYLATNALATIYFNNDKYKLFRLSLIFGFIQIYIFCYAVYLLNFAILIWNISLCMLPWLSFTILNYKKLHNGTELLNIRLILCIVGTSVMMFAMILTGIGVYLNNNFILMVIGDLCALIGIIIWLSGAFVLKTILLAKEKINV